MTASYPSTVPRQTGEPTTEPLPPPLADFERRTDQLRVMQHVWSRLSGPDGNIIKSMTDDEFARWCDAGMPNGFAWKADEAEAFGFANLAEDYRKLARGERPDYMKYLD